MVVNFTYRIAFDLVWCMACSINLVHCIKAGILKGYVHEVTLHELADLVNGVSSASVVVQCPTNLVCIVVQTWRQEIS